MSVLFLPPSAGAASVPDATETTAGKIRIATSAEATAGTNDLTSMTPLKVKSVVDAAVVGGVTYQGTFDASSPADLSNASKGDLYIISVAGSYQGQDWAVGDHLLINADMGGTLDPAKIDKVDNTDAVTSVAGRTGAVVLSTADVSGLATVATSGAYSDLSGTPSLATVATTGAYSDLTGTPTLGTAAAEDVGTSANNVVQLNGSAQLPAVDGSLLTNISATVAALNDVGDVTITGVADTQVIKYNSTSGDWENGPVAYADVSGTPTLATVATTGAYSDLSGTPSLATVATTGAYSDLSGLPTLGTAAALDVGTSATNVVQLDGSARLPAVDGSQLTNLPSGASTLGALTDVTITTPANTQVIKYNSTSGDWENGAVAYADVSGTPSLATVATTGAYSDLSGTPSLATVATTGAYSDLSGLPTLGTAAALDVGTSANNVVQLNGSAQLPAVDGSQLTGISASVAALDDIGDVDTTGVSTNNVLKYDGANWVDGSVAYSEVTGTPTLATVATTGAYSDLTGTPTLGTAAALDVGTSANNVVQLNGSAQLPAVDGSLLTGISASVAALNDIGDVSAAAPSDGDTIIYNSTSGDWEASALPIERFRASVSSTGTLTAIDDNRRQHYDVTVSGVAVTIPNGGSSDVTGGIISVRNASSGDITYKGPATSWADGTQSGFKTLRPYQTGVLVWTSQYTTSEISNLYGTAAGEDVGTSAGNVVQLDGSARLPAVDGSQLTNLPSASVAALNDIGDVSAAAPNNGDVIAYNSTSGDWEATAQSGGGSAPSVTVPSPPVSGDQTLTGPSGIEEVYIYTPTTNITVNLVAAATCGSGFKYQIKNRSTNTITIDPNGSETIDGAATFALSVQEASVTLITDGSNWFII